MATKKPAAKKKGGSGSKRSKATGRRNSRTKSKPRKTAAAARGTAKRRRRTSSSQRVARQQPEIVVRRTSGRTEKFDPDRLAQTTSRAGTPFLMARDIAKAVSKKVAAAAGAEGADGRRKGGAKGERVVEGEAIREMVREELVKRNEQDIASSLAGERPESTRQGRHEMLDKNEPVLDSTAANRTRLTFDGSSHLAKSTKVRGSA